MGVQRVRGASHLLWTGRLRRRLAVAGGAAVVAVLGMLSSGAPALASPAAPSAAHAPAKAHKGPFPRVVHPAAPPQGAGVKTVRNPGGIIAGNQPRPAFVKPAYSASMLA